jgi:poly(beta-D-mannuronate) lyase
MQMCGQYNQTSLNGLSRRMGALTCGVVAAFVWMPSLAVAADKLVHSQDEYEDAVDDAGPGDTILLANGTWDDFEIVFSGEGKADKPITLTAQTKGEVFITGQSNLRLGGNYLVVSGLVFKDGYTPTRDVISFRRTKQHLANNSRVTEVVIDNFNQPERYDVDFWVMMYGQNNRFDHNHLVGKRNKGVTMAVRLDTKASQENRHRIDHNYFGPRPVLGSNGGETLRIGTSKYSLSDSFTLVENNYFDRCDGEVEIISNKSGKNIYRNNTFDRSKGTLTLRHGNGNLVEGNVFFGHGVDHTGGIRVINADQTIQDNYLDGLTGSRFGGGFTVINGVPN